MQTNSENAVAEEIEESIAKVNVRGVVKEISMKVLFAVAAALFVLAVLTICIYLLLDAIPTIGEIGFVKFFTDDRWLIRSERFGIGSLVVGTALSTVGALVVGVPIGLMTATFMAFYCPRWLYKIIKPLTNILAGIPSTLLAIALAASFGGGIRNLIVSLGISYMPTCIRIVRSSVLSLRDNEFIEAAISIGAENPRIIFKHIMPNAMSPLIVQSTLNIARTLISSATLSFLGLGVSAPSPEWGAMLSYGRTYIQDYPHMVIVPGLAIIVTTYALNLLGDGLRDALDPHLKY